MARLAYFKELIIDSIWVFKYVSISPKLFLIYSSNSGVNWLLISARHLLKASFWASSVKAPSFFKESTYVWVIVCTELMIIVVRSVAHCFAFVSLILLFSQDTNAVVAHEINPVIIIPSALQMMLRISCGINFSFIFYIHLI